MMSATLVVFVPFDVQHPLRIPEPAARPALVRDHAGVDRARSEAAGMLADAWEDEALAALLGADRVVAVKMEAGEFDDGAPDAEHVAFPWGTNAILGSALRLSGRSGSLIEEWQHDVLRVANADITNEVADRSALAIRLTACRDWEVAIDVFSCGIGAVRLAIPLPAELAAEAPGCARLLEYAIYGDAIEDASPADAGQSPSSGKDAARRIDMANRALQRLVEWLSCHLRDPASEGVLSRARQGGGSDGERIRLRWTWHLLLTPFGMPVPSQITLHVQERRKALEKLRAGGDLADADLEIDVRDLKYTHESWFALAQAADRIVANRLLYVLTAAVVADVLVRELIDDLDRRLSRLMTSRSEYSAEQLREIRLFAQLAIGLTATWRVAADEVDVAIARAHAASGHLDRAREHLAAAVATLYEIEQAALAEINRTRSDVYTWAACAISMISFAALVLAMKDTDELVRKRGNLVRLDWEQIGIADGIATVILLVVLATMVWVGIRLYIAHRKARRTGARHRARRRDARS
jgi:hypothetical protein